MTVFTLDEGDFRVDFGFGNHNNSMPVSLILSVHMCSSCVCVCVTGALSYRPKLRRSFFMPVVLYLWMQPIVD